jgi:hypothetical protein
LPRRRLRIAAQADAAMFTLAKFSRLQTWISARGSTRCRIEADARRESLGVDSLFFDRFRSIESRFSHCLCKIILRCI